MTKIITTLIAGAAFVAIAGTASAENGFTAKFVYSPSASVDVTYAQFQKTAKQTCKISRMDAGGIAMKMKIERACYTRLVSDAVEATQLETLIAYHEQRMLPTNTHRQFAKLRD